MFAFTKNDFACFSIGNELPRQKRCKMFGYANWANAGTTAAVWNAKSFVQIQMTHVRADIARPAKADLRVHERRRLQVDRTLPFFGNEKADRAVVCARSHPSAHQ